MFADTPVVTVRGGMAALRLKVWDEERGCPRVPDSPRAPAAATELVEEPLETGAEQRIFDWLDESLAATGRR